MLVFSNTYNFFQVLADTINSMMPIEDGRKRLLTSLLICLAEWTMCVPTQVLLETKSDDNSSECLLHCVFKVGFLRYF